MITEIYRKPNCPYGKKAIELLNKKNIDFIDNVFKDKADEEAFKAKHNVKTTPQIFMDAQIIGGFSDLAAKYGEDPKLDTKPKKKSYKPIIAIFSVSVLLTLATRIQWGQNFGATQIQSDQNFRSSLNYLSGLSTHNLMMTWMGFFLVLLSLQKITDLNSFKNSFANYDLITKKLPFYALVYPFLELFAGLGFINSAGLLFVALVSSFTGFFGSLSIIKAVYIDKRDLNCACAGGNTNLPLGFVSLSENLIMFLMGIWILIS